MPTTGGRILDNQESLIEGLVAIEFNMKKLPHAQRDEAKLGSVMNNATTFWNSVQVNHKKVMELAYVPTSYEDGYKNAEKCYGRICSFVGKHFPKLVPEGVEIVDVDVKCERGDKKKDEDESFSGGGSGSGGSGGPGDSDGPGDNSDNDESNEDGPGGPGGPGGGGDQEDPVEAVQAFQVDPVEANSARQIWQKLWRCSWKAKN